MIKEVSPSQIKIGWVGTGVMGRWMCQHVMDLGYDATVFTRTKSKADPLFALGATWAKCPAEVAENSDIVFTIVGFPEDVRQVYLGESGILTTAKSGSIVVDMTTTEPSLAIEIHQVAQAQDVSSIDAPVPIVSYCFSYRRFARDTTRHGSLHRATARPAARRGRR